MDNSPDIDLLEESQLKKGRVSFQKFKLSPKSARIVRVSLLNVIFGVYFAWATYHYIDSGTRPVSKSYDAYCQGACGIQWCDGYGMLLLLYVFTYVGLFYYKLFKPRYGASIYRAIVKPIKGFLAILLGDTVAATIVVCLILIGLSIYVFIDLVDSRDQTRSLLGIVVFYGFGYVFSANRRKIRWRPVICGALFQFLLGILCIHSEIGRSIFACIGKKVTAFLEYAKDGIIMAYGEFLVKKEHVFAFAGLPVIFLFSFTVSILYYWGVMQWILKKLGGTMQAILGTTACESVAAVGYIFLGITESPLLIRPYMQYLTASELHAIMAGGFATVSGTRMVSFISYGEEASHLIISSVMSAPASLAFSKLFVPEVEETQTSSDKIVVEKTSYTSLLDAACSGAMAATSFVLGIAANLMAFVSFISFLNGVLGWLGYLIGHDYLSFEWILAKLLFPVAYILGVPLEDCEYVAHIIAAKTIISEFMAYRRLGNLRKEKLIPWRTSVIASFAAGGFANPGCLGIVIGGLSSICPEKRAIILNQSVRAFISGCLVCFINASIAGLLISSEANTNEAMRF